jgi:hypothetical protein
LKPSNSILKSQLDALDSYQLKTGMSRLSYRKSWYGPTSARNPGSLFALKTAIHKACWTKVAVIRSDMKHTSCRARTLLTTDIQANKHGHEIGAAGAGEQWEFEATPPEDA